MNALDLSSYERHLFFLNRMCRLCGERIKTKRARYPVKPYVDALARNGVDVTHDDSNVHPASMCSPCYSRLRIVIKKNPECRKHWQATWEKHATDNACPTCTKGENTSRLGRPKKRFFGGRPPAARAPKALPLARASKTVPHIHPPQTSPHTPLAQPTDGSLQIQTPVALSLTGASGTVPCIQPRQVPPPPTQKAGGILQTQTPMVLPFSQASETVPLISVLQESPCYMYSLPQIMAQTTGEGILQIQTPVPLILAQTSETAPITQTFVAPPCYPLPQSMAQTGGGSLQTQTPVPHSLPQPSEIAPLTQTDEAPLSIILDKTVEKIVHIDAIRNFSVEIKCKECLSLVSIADIDKHSCIVVPPFIALHDHSYIHKEKKKTTYIRDRGEKKVIEVPE